MEECADVLKRGLVINIEVWGFLPTVMFGKKTSETELAL